MALPAADDDARKADGTRAFRHEPQEAGQVCGGVRSFEIADSLALDVDAHRVDVRVARLWHEYGGDPMPHPLSSAARAIGRLGREAASEQEDLGARASRWLFRLS